VRRLIRRARDFIEAVPIADSLQRRHAVTLQLFALTFCAAALVVEIARRLEGPRSPVTLAINGVGVAVSLLAVFWIRRGDYRRAAWLLVGGFAAVQAVAISIGGLHFSRDGLKNVAVVLALAALVLGRRALWSMLAGFAVVMAVGWARDHYMLGGHGPQPTPPSPTFELWVLTFLVLAIVLDRFGLTVQEAFADVLTRQRQLQEAQELFRVAFHTSPSAISVTRQDGAFVTVNDGFTRLTGHAAADVVGRNPAELGLWVDTACRDRAHAALAREGSIRDLEASFRRRDGSVFTGQISAEIFHLGGQPHVLTVLRDVTAAREAEAERAQLQAQLLQAQKLESIGRLAGGVAHDLNNMITAVIGYTDLLEPTLEHPRQRADLEQVRLGGQRAASLTRQLLSFARKQPVEARLIDLNALVVNLDGLLRRLIGEHIDFVVLPGAREPWVRADPSQLEQVLVNLVVNARDAMGASGKLTIETSDLPAVAVPAARVPGLSPVAHAVISVRDSGTGMEPEVLQHLFEPFFTTKPPGKGTGLGLATCYGIVRQAGGQLGVETKVGSGSTFRVYLPRLSAAQRAPVDGVSPPLLRGTETVLLVEDEPQLRALASRVLREHGYRVLEGFDGIHGGEVAMAFAGGIDLLLTDVVMPRMGGKDLADRLRAQRPDLRVLFTSGYAESPDGLLDHGGLSLLQKPFTTATLLSRVRQVLDERGRPVRVAEGG
jgi:PAS domain S-box-containing protein